MSKSSIYVETLHTIVKFRSIKFYFIQKHNTDFVPHL